MDNFFARIFQRREATPAPISAGVPSSTNMQSAGEITGGGNFKEKIVRVTNPNIALTVSAVYRAVELKAKTIGQMEMQYQRKDTEKGNFIASMYGDGKLMNYLLQKRANPMMTSAELFQQMSVHRELLGNAFVYIERDDYGRPKNLWLALCGGYNPMTQTYTLTFNTNHGMRSKFEAPAEDVIHWRNTYRHYDSFMGIPTHVYAIQTLSLIATQRELSMESAAKGGRMKLIIGEDTSKSVAPISTGLFDKKEMEKYAAEIEQRLYQNDVVAMRALDKVQNISMTAQDMQMMEQLNISLDDLARFYATPRPLLMMDTNSHYNDYQNATMEYLQRTIAPLARELEELFDTKFLTVDDFGRRRFHLCELPLLRMDLERQAKVDQLNLQTGAKTVNEIRRQYDMPSVEDGDIVYVSTNLAELGSAKLRDGATGGRPTEPEPPQE